MKNKIEQYLKNSECFDEFYEQAQDEILKQLQVFTEEDIKSEATSIWDNYTFDNKF